jgi:hypothetical protein
MHILGETGVYQYGPLRMWAERGQIHIEDATDNSYRIVTVQSIGHRLQAHSDMLKNSREQLKRNGQMLGDEYNRQLRMIEGMIDVCHKAQEQGMPTDESAVRDINRRLPKTVVIPRAARSY